MQSIIYGIHTRCFFLSVAPRNHGMTDRWAEAPSVSNTWGLNYSLHQVWTSAGGAYISLPVSFGPAVASAQALQLLSPRTSPPQRRSVVACTSQVPSSEERTTLLPVHLTRGHSHRTNRFPGGKSDHAVTPISEMRPAQQRAGEVEDISWGTQEELSPATALRAQWSEWLSSAQYLQTPSQ